MSAHFWRTLCARLWREDEGLLTFEYAVLNTLLVVGTVSAVSGIRDSVNSQLNGLNQSIRALDQMRPAALGTSSGQTGNGATQTSSSDNLAPVVAILHDATADNAAIATTPNTATPNATVPNATTANATTPNATTPNATTSQAITPVALEL